MNQTIETKVIAAAAGGGAGAAIGSFCLWLLGVAVWHAPNAASSAAQAVAAVPTPVSGLTLAGLAAVGSFLSGYVAPHTSRVPGAHSAEATPAYVSDSTLPTTGAGLTAAYLAAVEPTPLDGLPPVPLDEAAEPAVTPSGATALDTSTTPTSGTATAVAFTSSGV